MECAHATDCRATTPCARGPQVLTRQGTRSESCAALHEDTTPPCSPWRTAYHRCKAAAGDWAWPRSSAPAGDWPLSHAGQAGGPPAQRRHHPTSRSFDDLRQTVESLDADIADLAAAALETEFSSQMLLKVSSSTLVGLGDDWCIHAVQPELVLCTDCWCCHQTMRLSFSYC